VEIRIAADGRIRKRKPVIGSKRKWSASQRGSSATSLFCIICNYVVCGDFRWEHKPCLGDIDREPACLNAGSNIAHDQPLAVSTIKANNEALD